MHASVGDVLLAVFSIIEKTEASNQDAVWDYGDVRQLHPFFISALAVYKDTSQGHIEEINVGDNLRHMFERWKYGNPVEFADPDVPEEKIGTYADEEFSPICKFSRRYSQIDRLQTALFSALGRQIKSDTGQWNSNTAIAYLLSELTCNIQEHSMASNGYLFLNRSGDNVYICVADNGITIHGSYIESARPEYVRLIGQDHAEALRYSTKGVSTKNRPDNESRGYGISTNLNMVVNGLGGEFYMLSGKALFSGDARGERFINLPENMVWDGTMIMVRIPVRQDSGFNVYKYME